MPRRIFSHLYDKTDTMSAYLPYESVYYERIADYYNIVKFAMLALLAVFVLAVAIFCNQDLRAENFKYLFKYIDVDPVATSSNYNDIYYNSNEKTVFAFYKGDLAVIGDGKLKLYNIAGNNILDEKLESENAVCDADGKYLVLYYPGENTLSVYNSFSKLYGITYDYPVISASAGENGSFAVITREASYRSAVYIYNSTFKSVYTWRSNEKYAVSAAVSPDGKNAAVLTYAKHDGTYMRELAVRNISKDKSVLTVSSEGGIPLKAGFFAGGRLYCLFSDGIVFYNKDFEQTEKISFSEEIQFFRAFSDGIVTVTGKTKADCKVSFYGSDGEKKLTKSFQYPVLDVNMIDDNIYLLTDTGIYRYNENGLACAPVQSGAGKMFLFDDGNVLLCYSERTVLVDKTDFAEINSENN
ncbi:MAG: hypothetical protein IJW21_09995 [Clostridia bacterium]|nr:hypothetical protein [Clostridia bacterium]